MNLFRSYRNYRHSVKKIFGDFEPRPRLPASANERVVLVFSHRSGSNLFASSLHANRIAKKAIPRYSTRDLNALQPRPDSFVAASHHIASDVPPQEWWHRSSVKMGWRQLLLLAENGAFADDGAYPPDRTTILRISRADTLRQAVSLVKAAQSDEWYHYTAPAGSDPASSATPQATDFTFDPERIATRTATFRAAGAAADAILEAIGADVFATTYEEFTADERKVMTAVRRRFDPTDSAEPALQTSFRKQASEINDEWYARTNEWVTTSEGQAFTETLSQAHTAEQEFIDKAAKRVRKATKQGAK